MVILHFFGASCGALCRKTRWGIRDQFCVCYLWWRL